MKSLVVMALELPDLYASYKEFMNWNVFSEGEEQADPNGEEQAEFIEKFYADLKEEKARKKGKATTDEEEPEHSPEGPTSGSGEE